MNLGKILIILILVKFWFYFSFILVIICGILGIIFVFSYEYIV